MKVSLKSKAEKALFLALSFIGLSFQKTKDGSRVAILQLEDPLPNVRGSQDVEIDGRKYPVTASDVQEIKVHEDDWNDNFQFDEDADTGSYEGSELMLDVSKQGEVWLRSTSFRDSGNEYRATKRNERFSKLVGKKGAAEPNPVDTTVS